VVKDLSDVENARLARFERSHANRRGRSRPSVLPSKLARTSAFAPTNRNLITDSTFTRVYVVEGHSVVEVRGRELGSQHRDALYALFRVRAKALQVPNTEWSSTISTPGVRQFRTILVANTTWRDLLKHMGRTEHVNNLGTVLKSLEELRSVSVRVYKGSYDQYLASVKHGRLAGAGFSDGIIGLIEWDGVNLDSPVRVEYGKWVRDTFSQKTLVSLNADTYFRLQTDYAKCLWPWIDSQPNHNWLDEPRAGELIGKPDIMAQPGKIRAEFRRQVREAFDDIVRAGGLQSWNETVTGSGRAKIRKFSWKHAIPRQFELDLAAIVDNLDL
jgi:hypothetical protein